MKPLSSRRSAAVFVAPSSELVGSPVSLLMVLEDRSILDKRTREKVLTWYACAQVVVTFSPQEFMHVAFKIHRFTKVFNQLLPNILQFLETTTSCLSTCSTSVDAMYARNSSTDTQQSCPELLHGHHSRPHTRGRPHPPGAVHTTREPSTLPGVVHTHPKTSTPIQSRPYPKGVH